MDVGTHARSETPVEPRLKTETARAAETGPLATLDEEAASEVATPVTAHEAVTTVPRDEAVTTVQQDQPLK